MNWVQLIRHSPFSLLGRWLLFPTSPCVKSELSDLPGSLRSKAPEHFSDLGRHLFFIFTTGASDWQNKWEEESSRDRWIPPRFQHKRSHRCIYMSAILGFDVHRLILVLFSLVPQRKHLSSILFDVWHDSPSLFTTHFCSVTYNRIWKPLS